MQFLDTLFLGYLWSHHLWRKFHDGFSVLHHLAHKSWAHHLAVVGYGVVEGEGRDRWHLGFISYTHPWQGGFCPVVILAVAVSVRHADSRRGSTHQRNLQVVVQTRAVDALHEFLRVVPVVVVDDAAHTDVGTVPQGLWQAQHSVSALAPVVVLHVSAIHLPYTAARIHMIGGINHAVV